MNGSMTTMLRNSFRLIPFAAVLTAPVLRAQATAAPAAPATARAHVEPKLRSSLYIYDMRTNKSKLVFAADGVWEAPNWSPDGKYLIANSKGGIYRFVLAADGTATPQRLAIPAEYNCNNDKSLSPDGTKIAFSASLAPKRGSQVFLANADGTDIKAMATETPSYFHGWSPDNKTLAFVAQRNGSKQYDIYGVSVNGGPETQLNSDPHQDDGPDYSPNGKWIYVNSDRTGKEAIWRFPATGAGPNDEKAENVVSDNLEDWFPHISPNGKRMLYIGYPSGTPTHDPRNVDIALKIVDVDRDKVGKTQKTIINAKGGQGSLNVNSWAPDSERFSYVTYEPMQ